MKITIEYSSLPITTRRVLARSVHDSEALSVMSEDSDIEILESVAFNPTTLEKDLIKLSHNENDTVRVAVAGSKSIFLTEDIMHSLVTDTSYRVRERLLKSKLISKNDIEFMSQNDPSPRIRRMAKAKLERIELLQQMAKKYD